MIRKLFIVAGSAFVLSVVCLAGATALVTRDGVANNWNWTFVETGDEHVRSLKRTTHAPEPQITKTLAWSGGDQLNVDVPAEVIFTQGAAASVTISGPKGLTERVRLENGRLYLADGDNRKRVNFKFGPDGFEAHDSDDGFKVVITAPDVKRFEISGAGDLVVRGYNQPKLDLSISGAGQAEVTGRTDALTLAISGAGDADLEALVVSDAEIDISGTGKATVGPTGKANVSVSGMGDVNITSKPAQINTNISGAGSIDQE